VISNKIPAYSYNNLEIIGLTIGKSYTFKLSAFNKVGESEYYVDKFTPALVPSKPYNLTAESVDTLFYLISFNII